MSQPGLFPYTSREGKAVRCTKLLYKITAAKTGSPMPIDDARALFIFDATTQAIIDAHLGTSSEFTAAQFDSTAMGADAFAAIVDMGKQVDELIYVVAKCYSGTEGTTQVHRTALGDSTLTDSTLDTECEIGSSGNVGIRVDFGNSPDFDALTAGQIEIDIYWRAK